MQKFLLILFVGVLVVFVSQQTEEVLIMNDVLLENVEALANSENSLPYYCSDSGDVLCPGDGSRVDAVYEGYSLR